MSPTSRLDCVVIGAGVIGLAVARALAVRGREVVVVERERRFGEGQSARNSEVIHAGIYYPPGSLKARACIAGKALLYRYCSERNIPHRRLGKLIVAADRSEVPKLERLWAVGRQNGLEDLRWLPRPQVSRLEPWLQAYAAILSPSTGIVDAHAFMLALLGDLEAGGGQLVYRTRVQRIGSGPTITLEDGSRFGAALVINAGGLHAHRLMLDSGWPPERVPAIRWNKGNYFAYGAAVPFSHLVYPLPDNHGLGIHLTLDMAGRARFGPDAHWVESEDYEVEKSRRDRFIEAIRRYFPVVDPRALTPDYAGIRATPADGDFIVHGPDDHGVDGVVSLLGIESPGLTAALALADRVAEHWG